ncbi:hypothetical protein K1719_000610 [Acacia pycnantha]|nr:hypothetical protein K1719_000610 [Acacia pycnantha]
MDPNSASDNNQILHDYSPRFLVYKDGHVERLRGEEKVPAGIDPVTGVQSKDITVNPQTGLSVRMFLPKTATSASKLPLLIYIHGGAFCTYSPFHPFYHRHLNTIAAEANAVVVSVNYRLAPEHPLPIGYDDTWEAIKWAAAHSNGGGTEPWLVDHADFSRVYFAGDSAGGNFSHSMAMQVGLEGLPGVKLAGIVVIHPYFGIDEKEELIAFLYPTMAWPDDPKMKPAKDPNLGRLGCRRVLVMVAGNDALVDRGRTYYEALKKSGWEGEVDLVEAAGEGHVFHLVDPTKEKAQVLVKQFVSFLTHN